jgi:N-acetyl-anhydromuramyl-L-alanine amidase AmpD
MNSREIIVAGRAVSVNADVVRDPKLQFSALGKRTETRAVLHHWTGGEGGGAQVFQTLKDRGLSVHFLIDQLGTIYQYADAALRCSHAGIANGWSVGVEISNRADKNEDHARWPRNLLRGRTDFYPTQYDAAKELTVALCRAFGLPRVAPMLNGKVRDGRLTFAEERLYRGVLGHYHVSEVKKDPGPDLLEYVTG